MAVSYDALRARFLDDSARESEGRHDMVKARLELALDAIGWRSAGGSSSSEVAEIAAHIVQSCVSAHHDSSKAVKQLAELLHNSAATLDGSMSSASMYVPAAEEVLARYAR
jgi:hypothetical protein